MRLFICPFVFLTFISASSLLNEENFSQDVPLNGGSPVSQEITLPEFSEVAQIRNIPGSDVFQPQAKIEKNQPSSENSQADSATPSRKIKPPVFESSSFVRLPNGSWAPSCKHVSEGTYCLKPDGEDAAIVQCLGENVGFQFKCANGMRCHSAGPVDVDCIRA